VEDNQELARLKEMAASEAKTDIGQKMMNLKAMAASGGKVKKPLTTPASVVALKEDEEEKPRTIEEFLEKIESTIVNTRHFITGKIDHYGRVLGLREVPPGRVPHVHQTHYLDSFDRPRKLEIFEKEFSKPITRLYFYEGDTQKVSESVWFNRYGKIDNIHRYQYDPETGLMTDRAEYNKEGEIFYQIHSEYDYSNDPPRLIEDRWADKLGRQVQRLVYKYDETGEVNIEERYDENNRMVGYHFITYDEKLENPVKKEWFGPDNVRRSFMTYEFDSSDNVTKASLFDGEGKKEGEQVFIYDDIGNLKEEKWFDKNGKQFKHLKY